MSNAQNGARIKCWAGSNVGSGIVQNITFENFVEDAVDNPVVIDQVGFHIDRGFPLVWLTYGTCQCYMTDAAECATFPSNTLIQDVVFNM